MGNDFRDLGKDIGSAVRDAITSGDFSDLNGRIANTVTDAISDLEERLRGKTAASDRKDSSRTQPQKKNDAEMAALRSRFTLSPKGRYSGFFMQFFGVLGGGAFGLAAVVTFVGAVIAGKLSALPTLLTVLCTIAGCCCALVYHNGKKRVQRVERFRKYVSLIGQKTYISIEELAAKSRKTEDYVVKDLEAMLELDMFPHGHLDDEKKTLLLTEAMFDEYRRLKKERILAPVEMKKPVEESDSDLLFRETEEKGSIISEPFARQTTPFRAKQSRRSWIDWKILCAKSLNRSKHSRVRSESSAGSLNTICRPR